MPSIKKSLWIFTLALIVGAVGVFAQSEDQTFVVNDIVLEGLNEIAEIPVRDQITFAPGDTITVQDLRDSAQNIFNMGFFRDVLPDIAQEADGIVITFQLEEFPILQGIEISGNRTYQMTWDLINLKIPLFWEIIKTDRVQEILENNNVKPFQIANYNDINDALTEILQVYQEKGYALFNIDDNQTRESIIRGDMLRIPIVEYLVEEVRIIGLQDEYEEIALGMVNLPDEEPVLVSILGANIAALSNSVYFMPATAGIGNFFEPVPGSRVDKIAINFNLEPRILIESPTIISAIEFEGHGAYSQARLRNQLRAWDNTVPMSNLELLNVLKGVFDLYRQSGYTQMDFELRDEGSGQYTVVINEGMVRNISLKLNGKTTGYTQIEFTPDGEPQIQHFDEDEEGFFYEVEQPPTLTKLYVVEKAMQIHPGDLFNENKLRDTIRTMLDLGYFADVQVDFEINEDKEVDVILEVFEAEKLGSFNAALSLAEGNLVGTLTLAEKNLFGTGQDISIDYDRGIMGPALTNWSFNYKAFGFFPLYKDFDVHLFQAFERPTFDEELTRMGGEISLTYPLTSTTDLTMGGRHENFQECLRDQVDCKPPGITDSVKFGVINDTRDNPLFPMEGGRRILQIEKAGGFSVGVEFTKLEGALIHHFFTFENQNVSARVFAGWGDSLPSQEKFAFGGPGTLRGGLTSRVSWLAFSNLEYRVKWLDQFSTALFTDWGITEKDDLTGTVGIEARVSLPIVGMTRFILAWPVNDPSYKTFIPRFQFSFGTMF